MSNCGWTKADGTPCTNAGKNKTSDGRALCGIHIKSFLKQGTGTCIETVSAPPSKVNNALKKTVAVEKSNQMGIYQNVKNFIDNNDPLITLNDEEKEIVRSLEKSPEAEFETIINCALRNSSSTSTKIDYPSIANNIPQEYFGYKKALLIPRIPMKIPLEMFPVRSKTKLKFPECNIQNNKIVTTRSLANSILLDFEDVNIKILNCRFVNISEWVNENNIYMGPAYGNFFFDSEWFIPFNPEFVFREIQNKKDVEEILKKIELGEEKKEKYLNLVGKTLGSVCIPNACHCEVYIEVVRALMNKTEN